MIRWNSYITTNIQVESLASVFLGNLILKSSYKWKLIIGLGRRISKSAQGLETTTDVAMKINLIMASKAVEELVSSELGITGNTPVCS